MKRALLFLLLLLPVVSMAQRDTCVTVFTIDSFKKHPGVDYDLQKNWRFHDGDSAGMAALDFDDHGWKLVSPATLGPIKGKDEFEPFSGVGWLRLHFIIDSGITDLSLSLALTQLGASEVYLDGKKEYSAGIVGTKDSCVYENPAGVPFPIVLKTSGEHVIAVKYANYNAKTNYDRWGNGFEGFYMRIGESQRLIALRCIQAQIITFLYILMFGIFIAISMLHLFLYLYYRAAKANLFFSTFCFSIALIFLVFYLVQFSTNPLMHLVNTPALVIIISGACLSLSGFTNSLYSSKKIRFRMALVFSIAAPFSFFINDWVGAFVMISLVFFVMIQVIIRTIWAMYHKKSGARILGSGVLFFTIFVLACLFFTLITGDLTFTDSTLAGTILIFLAIIVVLSLPVSISLYLAWNFANVNKDLKNQLDQVNLLSEKALEQELEKQRILENQKENLEQEVASRMSEIVAQRDKIEKQHRELRIEQDKSEALLKDVQIKNKAITDNITYAKRIQSAILPDIKLIYKTLEQSFILYSPKDIVSGDFYAFAEKNNRVLIVAGDCTGHGVSGALMSMIGSSLLNQIITEKGVEQPAMILNQLNSAVIETFRQGENEANDGMDVSICSINLLSNELQYAGANRPLWLIRDNEVQVYSPDKFPIGGLQTAMGRLFTNTEIGLEKNDTIYIFTDGYADQFGGEKSKKLMTARFKEILLSIQEKTMSEQEAHLKTFFETWKGGNEQVDDVLVIGIRI